MHRVTFRQDPSIPPSESSEDVFKAERSKTMRERLQKSAASLKRATRASIAKSSKSYASKSYDSSGGPGGRAKSIAFLDDREFSISVGWRRHLAVGFVAILFGQILTALYNSYWFQLGARKGVLPPDVRFFSPLRWASVGFKNGDKKQTETGRDSDDEEKLKGGSKFDEFEAQAPFKNWMWKVQEHVCNMEAKRQEDESIHVLSEKEAEEEFNVCGTECLVLRQTLRFKRSCDLQDLYQLPIPPTRTELEEANRKFREQSRQAKVNGLAGPDPLPNPPSWHVEGFKQYWRFWLGECWTQCKIRGNMICPYGYDAIRGQSHCKSKLDGLDHIDGSCKRCKQRLMQCDPLCAAQKLKKPNLLCSAMGQEDCDNSGPASKVTYVHAYGRIRHSARQRAWKAGKEDAEWCSASGMVCNIFKELVNHGLWATLGFVSSAVLLIPAFFLINKRWLLVGGILVGLSAVICFVTLVRYTSSVEALIEQHSPPLDEHGRNWAPSITGYSDEAMLLEKGEWHYLQLASMMIFSHRKQEWGSAGCRRAFSWYWMGAICIQLVLVSFFVLDLWRYSNEKKSAIKHACKRIFIRIVCCCPAWFKRFLDDNVAPYTIMQEYPWQKLYPPFSARQRCTGIIDWLWDYVIMLPVHLIRAIWDYVTAQDISSETEKKCLNAYGLYHDRCISLLVSRRSYFALVCVLGLILIPVTLKNATDGFRKKHTIDTWRFWPSNFLDFTCIKNDGHCAQLDQVDYLEFAQFSAHMLQKGFGIILSQYYKMSIGLHCLTAIFFVGSITCAFLALQNWPHFGISARFCHIGWFLMMGAPIISSFIDIRGKMDYTELHTLVKDYSRELRSVLPRDDLRKMCSKTKDEYLDDTIEKLARACWWMRWTPKLVKSLNSAQQNCKEFNRRYKSKEIDQFVTDYVDNYCEWLYDVLSDAPINMTNTKERDRQLDRIESMHEVLTEEVTDTIGTMIGIAQGWNNFWRIYPMVLSLVPALMQGALMMKNMVPQATMSGVFLILPFAYCPLSWLQYQLVYQVVGSWQLFLALFCYAWAPMLYYVFGVKYHISQPMDDQQSVTLTFRIWYYALTTSMILPYILVLSWLYLVPDTGSAQGKRLFENAFDSYFIDVSAADLLLFVASSIMSYAFTIQAGIDWFVSELASQHLANAAPALLSCCRSVEEAKTVQELIGTDIDLNLLTSGTYCCGGLADVNRLDPPKDVSFQEAAQIYAVSLHHKHNDTLDAFAMISLDSSDENRSAVQKYQRMVLQRLREGRQMWRQLLVHPPAKAFLGNSWTVEPKRLGMDEQMDLESDDEESEDDDDASSASAVQMAEMKSNSSDPMLARSSLLPRGYGQDLDAGPGRHVGGSVQEAKSYQRMRDMRGPSILQNQNMHQQGGNQFWDGLHQQGWANHEGHSMQQGHSMQPGHSMQQHHKSPSNTPQQGPGHAGHNVQQGQQRQVHQAALQGSMQQATIKGGHGNAASYADGASSSGQRATYGHGEASPGQHMSTQQRQWAQAPPGWSGAGSHS